VRLDGNVATVTGASRVIVKSIASAFKYEGLIHCWSPPAISSVEKPIVDTLHAGQRCIAVRVEISLSCTAIESIS